MFSGSRLREFLSGRVLLVVLAGSLALGARSQIPDPPELSVAGLAGMLGEAVGGPVAAEDIAWAPSSGAVGDVLCGRRVLFLARTNSDSPRDLYLARVRVSLGGQPVLLNSLYNLTRTPVGDESALQLVGSRAVFATTAFEQVQGVTVLELAGVRREDRPASWWGVALSRLSSLLGTGAEMGRSSIVLELPVRRAALELNAETLTVDVGESRRNLTYRLNDRTLTGEADARPYGASLQIHAERDKALVLWVVDTVRAVVGPVPIAQLETLVFGARDAVKRAVYAVLPGGATHRLSAGQSASAELAKERLEPPSEAVWPPAAIPSIWEASAEGEGEWSSVRLPGKAPDPGQAELFAQTMIRPDPNRPYVELQLTAMDMRRLELRMEAGYEDPRPLTGPPGAGHLPKDPDVSRRVVATFNGGFKTTHGEYGMMVNRRVLVPPVSGGATVVLRRGGDVGFGSWPSASKIPPDLLSFRQNLEPLVDDGKANPSGRAAWGWHLAGESVFTERTALCLTHQQQVLYAWSQAISAPVLARGLIAAGCDYAIHLDMNPKHCGLVFTSIENLVKQKLETRLAHPAMNIDPRRYALWSAKDFFYVLRRVTQPPPIEGSAWKLSPGDQGTEPGWPAIYQTTRRLGRLDVQIYSLQNGRVHWQLRAGSKEPKSPGMRPQKALLSEFQHARSLLAVGLGHATQGARYGLGFDGGASLALRQVYATVVLESPLPPRIFPPGQRPKLGPGQDAVQLPLLAKNGKLVGAAASHGAMRQRGALCVTEDGRTLIAKSLHDSSAPLGSTLLDAGCDTVVELDRGSHHAAFVELRGSQTPPLSAYETTVLHALDTELRSSAARWP